MNSSERSFRVIRRGDGGLCMETNGWTFDLAPPEIVRLSLPPYARGVDWLVREASRAKGISSDQMKVVFDENLFIGCDAVLSGPERSNGGWIYSISGECMEVPQPTKVWICDKMSLYFDKAPGKIHVFLDSLS